MSIRIDHLSHIYNQNGPYEKTALRDINLTVEDGAFIGLIGHTGSGKSTLIQHLNGILKPTSGTVWIGDTDIFAPGVNLRQIRKQVGLVFQYPEHQLFEETVYKDIAFGPKNYGATEEEVRERVLDAAKTVGLKEKHLEKSPFELSGGQKRKAAIAGVLATQPDVLILDEPAAGLDPFGREKILYEIQKIHEEKKITVILVSHSMEDIARVAERIVVMHEGEIAMSGTPREVFAQEEALSRMRLDIPQVAKILNALAREGLAVPKGIFTVEQAADAIQTILKAGK